MLSNQASAGPMPLTVIGGFLGAGKTSLVNHLLRTATQRIGVLVNDFGAVNIDAALIGARHPDSIALTNGCVCCSLGDDLALALQMLRARKPRPDQVIIEASGIADPWRIAEIGLTDPAFALAPVVVVVDAANLARHLADPAVAPTLRRQLALAELVVLNKSDLAADFAGAAGAVAAIRPQALLIAARHGEVDAAELRFEPPARPPARRLHADAPHPFVTVHWPCPAPLDGMRLRTALEGLPGTVLRVKGFFRLGREETPSLLQYAAERWAITEVNAAGEPGFVIIGTADMPDPAALFGHAVLHA